jgi:hypothetical protein
MPGEKALDVVTIDGPPPVQTELAAYRLQPPEVTETYAPHPRTSSPSTTPHRPLSPPLQAPILIPEPLDLLTLFRQLLL